MNSQDLEESLAYPFKLVWVALINMGNKLWHKGVRTGSATALTGWFIVTLF